MDFQSMIKSTQHFKLPDMQDWLVVKGGYIVFEHDPRARPILPVKDMLSLDWMQTESNAQLLASQFDLAYKSILRDPETKLSDAAVERFLALEDVIKKLLEEQQKQGQNNYTDRFDNTIKVKEVLIEQPSSSSIGGGGPKAPPPTDGSNNN